MIRREGCQGQQYGGTHNNDCKGTLSVALSSVLFYKIVVELEKEIRNVCVLSVFDWFNSLVNDDL